MTDVKGLAEVVQRMGLVNPKDPVTDKYGNIEVFAPVAEANAAVTVINPTRSENLGGMCKNCHTKYVGVGIRLKFPNGADDLQVCAPCLTSLFKSGGELAMTFA